VTCNHSTNGPVPYFGLSAVSMPHPDTQIQYCYCSNSERTLISLRQLVCCRNASTTKSLQSSAQPIFQIRFQGLPSYCKGERRICFSSGSLASISNVDSSLSCRTKRAGAYKFSDECPGSDTSLLTLKSR